jgi:hypothetical protein
MASQQNHNLSELLKASGYNEVDHGETGVPPHILEVIND